MFTTLNFPFDRLGVGFEVLQNSRASLLEAVKRQAEVAFPPYNIRKTAEDRYVVEIAAAGNLMADFSIELDDDVLRVKCNPPKEDAASFIHKGLTSKPWNRDFILADGVEVKDATLVNGMLRIFLDNVAAKEKKPLKINIQAPSEKSSPQLLNESSNF